MPLPPLPPPDAYGIHHTHLTRCPRPPMATVCDGITAYKHGITLTFETLVKSHVGGNTMGKIIPLKMNDDELERLERAFAASGEEFLSTHIKKIYFEAVTPGGNSLRTIKHQLDAVEKALEGLAARPAGGGEDRDETLLLTLVCGIYHMLRESVGPPARILADKTIDANVVENYLRGKA